MIRYVLVTRFDCSGLLFGLFIALSVFTTSWFVLFICLVWFELCLLLLVGCSELVFVPAFLFCVMFIRLLILLLGCTRLFVLVLVFTY